MGGSAGSICFVCGAHVLRDADGSLLARSQEERVTVRTPVRPQVRHITQNLQRDARTLHPENLGAFALWTIPPFAYVSKQHQPTSRDQPHCSAAGLL